MIRLKFYQLICLMFFPLLCQAQVAKVQCVLGTWASGSTYTASITATTGNLLWANAKLIGGNSSIVVSGIADGTNGSYTSIDDISNVFSGTMRDMHDFYAKNITGGALTVTVTLSQSIAGNTAEVQVCEFSGLDTTAPLESHTAQYQTPAPGTGTDLVSSGNITTTHADAVAGGIEGMSNDTLSLGTGYSAAHANSIARFLDEYLIQSSGGTLAATATATGGATNTYLVNVAAFKPAGAAAASDHSLSVMGVGH